jgi:hypothetical protein
MVQATLQGDAQGTRIWDLAYTAGLMDGDGSIGLHRQHYRGRNASYNALVQVSTVHRGLAEWLQGIFGGHIVERKPKSPRHRTQWNWTRRRDGAA